MSRAWIAVLAVGMVGCAAVAPHASASASPTASPSSPSPSPSSAPTEAVATPGPAVTLPIGSWETLPPLPTGVAHPTATLLPNGKALIVGGLTNIMMEGVVTSAVEVYDPVTKTFRAASTLSVGRAGHTATLLRSGKVLVVGGHAGSGGAVSTPEIFDPATDSWVPATAMNHARTGHAAVLLADGRVFVTGGTKYVRIGIGGVQNAAPATLPPELYNPTSDTWTDAALPALDRPLLPSATLMASGKILVVGGQYLNNSPDENLERSEIYDPANNSWKFATPETHAGARQFHTALSLSDGKILIAGGWRDEQSIAWANLYDPSTDSWTLLPNMRTSHCGPGAGLLPSGRALVFGDYCGFSGAAQPFAEEFDPSTNRWYSVARMTNARGETTSVRLNDGTVLAIGGYYVSDAAELFHPQ